MLAYRPRIAGPEGSHEGARQEVRKPRDHDRPTPGRSRGPRGSRALGGRSHPRSEQLRDRDPGRAHDALHDAATSTAHAGTRRRASCSAPPESSHLIDFVRPEVARAPIAQRLVRALLVVPADPRTQLAPGVFEADEVVLPDAFLLQAAEEALDDSILLGRIRCDELLHKPVVSTRRAKASTLIDQAVVGADDRRSAARAQGAEPFQTGLLERPLGLLRPPAPGELVADELPVVAIDHRGERGPAVAATVHVGQVRRPPLVAAGGLADPALHPRPRRRLALVDEPPFERTDAIHGFRRDALALPKPQQGPEPPIPEGRVALNQCGDPRREALVQARRAPAVDAGRAPHPTPGHRENPTASTRRHPGQCRSYSSDVFGAKGRSLLASFRMSRSRTSSPTFCLSFLICSSFRASSSLGRARSAFSAPSRNRSRHSSTSATVSPCFRAAACADVSPFKMLRISVARRFAVQRWGDSGVFSAMAHLPP